MRNLHNLIQVICEFESKFHTDTRVETPHNMLRGGRGNSKRERVPALSLYITSLQIVYDYVED